MCTDPQPARPWWAADETAPPPSPLGSLRLLGLERTRLELALSLVVVALVAATRVAALPLSIWEQDEAYFACAVVHFDVALNHPHPPWFPLWIGLGKLAHLLGGEPARGLQLISLVFGVWMLFPLVALWRRLLCPPLALAAALAYLVTPAAWLLAGRAFSGTAATSLLVAALAWALAEPPRGGDLVCAATAAALAVLVRPQLVVPVVLLVAVVGRRHRRQLVALAAPLLGLCGLGVAGLLTAAGGASPLLAALREHLAYHFGLLHEADRSFRASGLTRSLGGPLPAALWLGFAAVGLVVLARRRTDRRPLVALVAVLAGLAVVVYGLSDPSHARYFLPVLALGSGASVAGLATLVGRRLVAPALAAALALSAATVIPWLAAYRQTVSPPLAAVRDAVETASASGSLIVADRTLVAFLDYAELVERRSAPVLYDHLLESGAAPAPPPELAVALFDAGHERLLRGEQGRVTFSCSIPLVRRLGQDRFLDVSVVLGPRLAGGRGRGPVVVLDSPSGRLSP